MRISLPDLAALSMIALPLAAFAHVEVDGAAHAHADFMQGFVHPLPGLDHLAAMMAATLALHAAGIAGGWMLRERGVWLPRAAGAAVAMFGVSLLAPLT